MTKKPTTHPDPLVMKVRKVLKSMEDRPVPTERRMSNYGYPQVQCPDCGLWLSAKAGNYNQHWTLTHGTPFWKELKLIEVVRGAKS